MLLLLRSALSRNPPVPGTPRPGPAATTPAERNYRRRPGPGRDREHAARLTGDADLGHRVYREVDRCPVGHLHHANGKSMPRPVRFPGVLPPDLADRDLGGEPQR